MESPPFAVTLELPGWALVWAEITTLEAAEGEAQAALRAAAESRARAAYRLETLAEHPTAAALRALFRAAGCDPTRYRPSSEALLRRVLKGDSLPAIHPLVDLNNALSMALAVPACVTAWGRIAPPVTLRAGHPGEEMASLRGPFPLAGKPLLADADGPFGTPITDHERVKVTADARRALLVAYLPAGGVTAEEVEATLRSLVAEFPLAAVGWVGLSV